MKKFMTIALLALVSSNIYASSDERIYCPKNIICKGTIDSCYVSNPKNYDENFILDKTHHPNITDADGLYIFNYAIKINNTNDEYGCEFIYSTGSNNPHIDTVIYYENKIRMRIDPDSINKGYWTTGRCSLDHDPSKCSFLTKP